MADTEAKAEQELEEEEQDEEVEELKRRLEELEKEEEQIRRNEEQQQQQQQAPAASAAAAGAPVAIDENSIHVGNLAERTTPDDLQAHFKTCGEVKRITIICDKWTGRPKGYAYIEFMEATAVELALAFHESSINGQAITVTAKRQNVPAFILRGRGGYRGGPPRGGRGGGYRGGGYRGGPPRGGYRGNYTRGYAPY